MPVCNAFGISSLFFCRTRGGTRHVSVHEGVFQVHLREWLMAAVSIQFLCSSAPPIPSLSFCQLLLSLFTSLHFAGEESTGRGPVPRRPLPRLLLSLSLCLPLSLSLSLALSGWMRLALCSTVAPLDEAADPPINLLEGLVLPEATHEVDACCDSLQLSLRLLNMHPSLGYSDFPDSCSTPRSNRMSCIPSMISNFEQTTPLP